MEYEVKYEVKYKVKKAEKKEVGKNSIVHTPFLC